MNEKYILIISKIYDDFIKWRKNVKKRKIIRIKKNEREESKNE